MAPRYQICSPGLAVLPWPVDRLARRSELRKGPPVHSANAMCYPPAVHYVYRALGNLALISIPFAFIASALPLVLAASPARADNSLSATELVLLSVDPRSRQ